jgi:hypothetical protein
MARDVGGKDYLAGKALKENPFGHLKQSDHRRKAWKEAWQACAIDDADADANKPF